MPFELINPKGLEAPVGYAHVAKITAGTVVHEITWMRDERVESQSVAASQFRAKAGERFLSQDSVG